MFDKLKNRLSNIITIKYNVLEMDDIKIENPEVLMKIKKYETIDNIIRNIIFYGGFITYFCLSLLNK